MTTAPVRRTGALAALALAASTLAGLSLPATSAQAADDNISLQGAQDVVSTWVGKHDAKLKQADGDAFRRAGTFRGDNGTVAVAYERTHEGLPVIGGDFVVMTDKAGQVISTSVAPDPGRRPRHDHRDRHGGPRCRRVPRPARRRRRRSSRAGWSSCRTARAQARLGDHRPRHRRRRALAPVRVRRRARRQGAEHHRARRLRQGNAAYSGPSPLTLNTTASGGTFRHAGPASTTRVCQDAANNTTFSGPDDTWGNGVATNKETGCVDACSRRPRT